jgi:soluble lytic murein transglycosylase-like protein
VKGKKMSWAAEFKSLARAIAEDRASRSLSKSRLQSDVLHIKGEWKAERAKLNNHLNSDFKAWENARSGEADELRAAAANLIDGFKKEREAAAEAWRELLENVKRHGGTRSVLRKTQKSGGLSRSMGRGRT